MLYTIELQKMEFHAYHGCYALEQRVGNRFHVDLKIKTELGEVAERDDVTLVVNYLKVYEAVREVMKETRFTIECVAQNIIRELKAQFPAIVEIECRVAKLAPPLGGKLKEVSVTLVG